MYYHCFTIITTLRQGFFRNVSLTDFKFIPYINTNNIFSLIFLLKMERRDCGYNNKQYNIELQAEAIKPT